MLSTPEAQIVAIIATKAFAVGFWGVLFLSLMKRTLWWLSVIVFCFWLMHLGMWVGGVVLVERSPLSAPYVPSAIALIAGGLLGWFLARIRWFKSDRAA